jgi:hypothetical protein
VAWVIGIIVVLLVLVVVARRRIKRDPSYDDGTQDRIDDHASRRSGDNLHDRFGGGQI